MAPGMAPVALLLGASSGPGAHLLREPPPGWTLEAAGRTDPRIWGLPLRRFHPLDLTDEGAVRGFLRQAAAEVWINLAVPCPGDGPPASPREDGAPGPREDPVRVLRAELPGWLAEEAERQDRYLVQLSTDEVFDGAGGPYDEDDPPSPPSAGHSAAGLALRTGEARVYASGGRRAIVRVCRPYGGRHPSREDWVTQWWRALQRGAPLVPPSLELTTPTWVPDLTRSLGAILERQARRIYHVASPEVVTMEAFLRRLCREAAFPWPWEGRCPSGRGRCGGLKVREIHKLDVRPVGFREGLRQMVADRGVPALSEETS
jgi:dTDP-4-dehydrorhamnose reductase